MAGADQSTPKRGLNAGKPALFAVLSCAFCATLGIHWLFWGYSVDDALIVARAAQHGLEGQGLSFHSGFPSDGVTPLGFAHLVAGLSWLSGVPVYLGARMLGLVSSLCAVVLVGLAASRRRDARASAAGLMVLSCSVPLAAWAGAGLETPLVALLVTSGSLLIRREALAARLVGGALMGVAAAWRNELLPFAATGCLLWAEGRGGWRAAVVGLVGPVLAVVAWRYSLFGTLLPLAFVAKAPEPVHGLRYAVGAALLSGTLLPLLGEAFSKGGLRSKLWLAPFLVHLVALFLAGGDWMALYRLLVPVLPIACFYLAWHFTGAWRQWLGVSAGLTMSALLGWTFWRSASRVVEQRSALIANSSDYFRSDDVVATVDIGWVGAAHRGEVLDLAGVTDAQVAGLPGGHTSKAVPMALLDSRDVTVWVLRSSHHAPSDISLRDIPAIYAVDHRLLQRAEDAGFVNVTFLPLRGRRDGYAVLRRARAVAPN